ncbi:hypothetical protein CLOP_g2915 [Closterium sp. NIES-67]|nr:hypothetical protein CLOP_g2915 [Closterium sp. NIES-67]
MYHSCPFSPVASRHAPEARATLALCAPPRITSSSPLFASATLAFAAPTAASHPRGGGPSSSVAAEGWSRCHSPTSLARLMNFSLQVP